MGIPIRPISAGHMTRQASFVTWSLRHSSMSLSSNAKQRVGTARSGREGRRSERKAKTVFFVSMAGMVRFGIGL